MLSPTGTLCQSYLDAGFFLAATAGRTEPYLGLNYQRSIPTSLGRDNVCGKYANMVALCLRNDWVDRTAEEASIQQLLGDCTPPKISIPHFATYWLMKFEQPFYVVRNRSHEIANLGATVLTDRGIGVLLPPSLLVTTKHGLQRAQWVDEQNIAPTAAPAALIEVLTACHFIERGL